jgi:hypothetical protein
VSYKSVFRRYEVKYLLTDDQKTAVLDHISPYMKLDNYGKTTIRNVYFDDASYRLIRRSIEKPDYKEKLRVRSYGRAESDDQVFVELKKKFDHVVYKRRIALPQSEAFAWLCSDSSCNLKTQITSEIDYFKSFYSPLRPSVFLSYEREAFYEIAGGDLRITFDDNILARREELSLSASVYGRKILPEGRTLMEIKCSGAIPLWLTGFLSRERIFKTSFSKYGTAYRDMIFPEIKNTYKELIHNV